MSSLLQLFDANRPHDGAVVKGQEIRELLKSVATLNAGLQTPGKVAILIGDARFASISVATNYRIRITINSVERIVDLSTVAVNNLVTPANVVTAINTAFGATYAYVYNTEVFDGTSFIALVATGTNPTITIGVMADTTDAAVNVFGIADRNAGVPYTVTGVDAPVGLLWYETGVADSIRMKLGSPARVTGSVNLAAGLGTVNLSARPFLRIKITGDLASFGPITVDVKGANPSATQPSEIVTAINAAFTALPGWPNVGSGPARLVTKEAGSSYLEIVSGPVASPYVGPLASVELSGLAVGGSLGVNFLMDDAITDLFGLARGEQGKVYQRVPHTFIGADYSTNFIRGITGRSGPGIGSWGPSMESSKDITAKGAVDGEVRIAKDTGIPWIYRQGQFGFAGDGWRRAVPGNIYPLVYSKALESYKLKTTTDTFTPQPLSRLAYSLTPLVPAATDAVSYVSLDPGATQSGQVGDALALVDAKDFLWNKGPYSGGRNFYVPSAVWDNFPTARYRMGRTREGVDWRLSDSNTPAITGTSNQRLRPTGSNIASTAALGASTFSAVRAYAESAGSSGYYIVPTLPSSSQSFTIPNVAGYVPVKQKSFSIRIVPRLGDASNTTSDANYTYYALDDGAGNIAGSGITGTINYTTGVVNLTIPSAADSLFPSTYALSYSYAQSNLQVISVDIRKDPNGETRAANGIVEPAEAGIIYNAIPGNLGSGYAVIVRDDGTGQIYTLQGGTPIALPSAAFAADPPLDTTWRTLRIVLDLQPGSVSHFVFWNGSNKPTDWIATENYISDAGLTASQTNGGKEVDSRGEKIVAVVAYPPFGSGVDPNEGGYFGGLWAKGTSAGGGYNEKVVQFQNFQNHSGSRIAFNSATSALPPVSGIRLRDTINCIQLQKNGVTQTAPVAVISDCNAMTPLVINLGGDLATSSLSGIQGDRQIGIGINTSLALATKEQRYLVQDMLVPGKPGLLSWNAGNDQQNVNGRVAYWSLSKMLVPAGYSLSFSYAPAEPSLLDYAFQFPRIHDGQYGTLNQPVIGSSVGSAYFNPNVTTNISGTLYNPGMSQIGASALWSSNLLNRLDINITTTLPADGHNGIYWEYFVTRASVPVQRSQALLKSTPGFSTSPLDSGNIWGYESSYEDPKVNSVLYSAALSSANGGKFAVFTIGIPYYGPVRPSGLYLDIMAVRRGTSSI